MKLAERPAPPPPKPRPELSPRLELANAASRVPVGIQLNEEEQDGVIDKMVLKKLIDTINKRIESLNNGCLARSGGAPRRKEVLPR